MTLSRLTLRQASLPVLIAINLGLTAGSVAAAQSHYTVLATGSCARQVTLGVSLPGVPRDIRSVDAFARTTGQSPDIVHYFQLWGLEWNQFDAAANDAVRKRGAVPMVSWDPWAGRLEDRRYALRTIVQGRHDRYIGTWARAAKAWGKRIFVRFAAEMNGDWEPWSRWHNGNEPRHYVRAWRHVVRIFRTVGATNVKWVWAPNEVFPRGTPLEDLYPGDEWVDWVGFSAYNWGSSRGFESWTEMIPLYRPTVLALQSIAPSKPVMVAETASVSGGGDKAAWIRNGFSLLPIVLPEVRAVVWFNHRAQFGAGRVADWRIEEDSSTLGAYREVVTRSTYGASQLTDGSACAPSGAGLSTPASPPPLGTP
jgi:hypothetical protein